MVDFDALEREQLEGAPEALEALPVARRATDVLVSMIDGVTTPPASEKPPPSFYMREATFLLSVLAWRTARACLLVVAVGYWPESHGLKRRLSEAHARAQAVAADESGQHARDWLEGRGPSTPPRIVNKFGSADLWKVYGWGAHADAQSVHQWLSVPMPQVSETHKGLVVPPHHNPDLSNALLNEVAMECRDMAAAMAVCREPTQEAIAVNLATVHALDPDIEDLIRRYYVAADDRPDYPTVVPHPWA